MKKQSLLFLLVFFMAAIASAQKQAISGRVVDNQNQPLPGASILVIHHRNFAISQSDGSFKIEVDNPAGDSLLVSNVGYTSQRIAISGRTSLQVQMLPNTKDLDDVVVISALGLTKKLNAVTYAQQSVDVDQMTEARDINITNMLAGKVAGLQVTNTGQPGSSSRVVIRGESSLTGNNQPLWVVDGVPIANDMGDTRGDNLDYGNGAADLNPDDIASIEVLKGPNAAALYGSQAANGAILVTTKRGSTKDQNLGITFDNNLTLLTITAFPAYQNIYGEGQFSRMVTNNNQIIGSTGAIRMGTNGKSWGAPLLGQPYLLFNGDMSTYSPQPGNVAALYKNSLTDISNLSISKSDAVSSFRLSYTLTRSNDVLENQNLNLKHNVSLSATRKVGKHINIDTRFQYIHDNTKNRTYRNLDPSSPMAAYVYLPRSANMAGFAPWVGPDGNAINLNTFSDTENPYWSLYENKNQDTHDRLIGGVTATIDLAPFLKLRTQATLDYEFLNAFQYKEKGGNKSLNGYYYDRNQNNQHWNYEAMLMFNKDFSKDLSLTANLATSYANDNSSVREQVMNMLLNHDMPSISNANTIPIARESLVRQRRFSVYGSATLGYKNYLFLDVTGRNDWSSTLPINNDSYFYPSVGGSFVFSHFIQDKSILSYGKARISFAGVGNAASPYSLLNTYSNTGLFDGNPSMVYGNVLKNYDLKPEHTNSSEVGLDLGFFNQRVNLTATLYKSNTTNQIIQAQSLTETGFTNRIINAGNIQNKGIELTADFTPIQTKDFSWNVTMNWSKNENKVLALSPGVDRIQLAANLGVTVNAIVGYPYGEMMGTVPYKVGDTTMVNTGGRVYTEQNQLVGNFQPDWLGSFGSTFKYKNFDLSVLFTVKWGGNLYSASYGRANGNGTTVASLDGRDEYYLSNVILGESDNERKGIGQTVGTTVTYYDDDRAKGRRYPLSYFPLTDAQGNILYDKNGRMIPGQPNNIWGEPQALAADFVTNNVPAITYDATSIKLSQLILGYSLPQTWLKNNFIKGVRLAFVGRNLWQILQHTPQGIDPESANSSGNGQGIEAGGSFPYAQYGFDLKVNF